MICWLTKHDNEMPLFVLVVMFTVHIIHVKQEQERYPGESFVFIFQRELINSKDNCKPILILQIGTDFTMN